MFEKFTTWLRKAIFPRNCLICNRIIGDGWFCVEDWNNLQFLQQPACVICFHPFEYHLPDEILCASCLQHRPLYNQAISVLKYDDHSSSLITRFKYHDTTHMAKYLATLMYSSSRAILDKIDFIVPVPLHKAKLRKRKFNQSAILANHVGKLAALKNINDLLLRIKDTDAQASLNYASRQRNISGAFILNSRYSELVRSKNILLIDDVITSGATIEACCRALLKNDVGKIYVLTLAKRV